MYIVNQLSFAFFFIFFNSKKKKKMLLGLLLLPLMAMAAPADNLTYAVMMDAGSTGSRVHVYVLERVADSSVPNVLDDHFLEVKPGIYPIVSSFPWGGKGNKEGKIMKCSLFPFFEK